MANTQFNVGSQTQVTFTLQLGDLLLLFLLQLQVSLLVITECPAKLFSLFSVIFLKVSVLFL